MDRHELVRMLISWGIVCVSLTHAGLVAAQPLRVGKVLVTADRLYSGISAGKVVDAAHDGAGQIFVLDGETNDVLLFGLDGQRMSRLSNTGTGGPRMASPIRLAIGESKALYVLDSQGGRLVRLAEQQHALTLVSTARTGLTGVSDLCELDRRLYVLGSIPYDDDSEIVHVLDREGAVVRSFGEPLGTPGGFDRVAYGVGHLYCSAVSKLVVAASRLFPTVRAFSVDGSVKWTTVLTPFRRVGVEETLPGTFEYRFPADSLWEEVVSLFSPSRGVLAVQVGRRKGRAGGSPYVRIETRFFSVSDGRELGTQTDLPIVLHASDRVLVMRKSGGAAGLTAAEFTYVPH